MAAKIVIRATLSGLCAVLAAGAVQAQQVKPGLWEMRVLKMEQDGKDMLDQMRQAMASLPPDQRKKIGLGSDPAAPMHLCISPEMAKSAEDFVPHTPRANGCSQPKINRSGDRITAEVSCQDATMNSEMVIAGDQVSSKSDVVSTVGGAKHTLHQETQMKLIGSDCGDLKPIDQARAGAPEGQPQKK